MPEVQESIMDSVKAYLGIVPEYDAFDNRLVPLINTVFPILYELGVGPDTGFRITGNSETWEDYIGDDDLMNMVPSYVFFTVELMFSPPTSSFAKEAIEKNRDELGFRIQCMVEHSR